MKVGMLAIWDKWGARHPTTVLQLDGCQVVQAKTEETNGYTALQLGVGEAKLKRVNMPLAGHYTKAGVVPKRKLMEFRVTADALLPVGTTIEALHFVPGQKVDVCGISKGKGYAGVMKRWNFGGGRATHGNSLSHRIPGSTGCRQDPGKVFKNKKMSGHLGVDRVTTQNLTVMKVRCCTPRHVNISVSRVVLS
jgi:large subunit ribosomal protein L3